MTWHDRSGILRPDQIGWLCDHLLRSLKSIGVQGDVRVCSVGDAAMSCAHQRDLGVSGSTDVITYDIRSDAGDPVLDLDALICVDEARRQSELRGHTIERELLLYSLHAVLHCCGEDDHDEVSSARMHAREDAILMEIGVGPTYAAGPEMELSIAEAHPGSQRP